MTVVLRPLSKGDAASLPDRSDRLGRYFADQEAGRRWVRVAELAGEVAGFITLLWEADDPALQSAGVPEISDLQVFPSFRRRGIGSALVAAAEEAAAARCDRVGLNVGLHSGYGAAQRIYALRGYVPDGSGVVIDGVTVPEGAVIRLDDDPIVTLRLTKSLRPTG